MRKPSVGGMYLQQGDVQLGCLATRVLGFLCERLSASRVHVGLVGEEGQKDEPLVPSRSSPSSALFLWVELMARSP